MTANEMPSGASGEPVHLRRPTLDDERLRLALEAGAMGTWAWDVASARVTWDAAMEARYGLAPGTFPGTFDAFLRLVHPNDVDAARRRIESALRAGEDLRYEHRVVWPNGEVHWLEGRGRVVHDADGTPVAMVGIGMDIDQRKASEAAIAEAVRLRTEHARSAIQVLQETLVPADFPDVRGYRLAGRYMAAESEHNIGGDWYDAFAVDERRVLVSVGDVSGHGVLAGRTMAKMRHAARAFACEDPDPGSVVTRLDNFFRHLRRGDEIVTVLVGLLDTERHTLELYSAGHVPPLVLRDGSSAFLDLDVRPPLGVATEGAARTSEVALDVGTTVLLYTDGLVERRGEHLDDGLERLARSARAALSDDVVTTRDAVIASCIGSREDDLCLLILARTGA
jgi:PAS domain S-box-containing protein